MHSDHSFSHSYILPLDLIKKNNLLIETLSYNLTNREQFLKHEFINDKDIEEEIFNKIRDSSNKNDIPFLFPGIIFDKKKNNNVFNEIINFKIENIPLMNNFLEVIIQSD